MNKISLANANDSNLKIMIFVEGTILKPKSRLFLYNHNSYVPIGNAVRIISSWHQQGVDIIYCTSRKKKSAGNIAALITKFSFPGSCLVYREPGDGYEHIVESILPDILIEDNCKSIGGAWQMCITKVSPPIKCRIKSIVVPEFKGIDSLSEDINKLKENCCSTI